MEHPMNPVAAQSSDALLRGPIQGNSFADMGAASSDQGGSSDTGGGIASQRAESLRTVSSNKIDAPVTGGSIAKPEEGAASMDVDESIMSAMAALMQKFADAQEVSGGM